MKPDLVVRRIYAPVQADDGARVLVDRLWPRGISKERAALALWAREAAPSDELRRWAHAHPDAWDEFVCRYRAELDEGGAALLPVRELLAQGRVTLLYAAQRTVDEGNNATVLRDYLLATPGKH